MYEPITGMGGVFSTKIAYVLHTGDPYELQIADADGQNPQVMLRSKQPIISPAWSPKGDKLAYVSFELDKPVVYVQNLRTAEREPVANLDRKSTRLNSSHVAISYAAFCLQKKNGDRRVLLDVEMV